MNVAQVFRGELKSLVGKRIALIGGAGFIGHNLALALQSAGAEPHIIDGLQVNNLGYYSGEYRSNPFAERYISVINERLALLRAARVPLHVADVRDYHLTSRILSEIEPSAIVHLAAVAHANRSNKDPYSTFDHSLRSLENVLDAARSMETHLVYFSSSMVYGHFGSQPAVEEQRCEPIGIYGALKLAGEHMVVAYQQVFGLPYTIVRPSALYGQRCVSRRVAQAFIENALEGRTLKINGDGSDCLDFTYIEDLIQGVLLTLVKTEVRNEIFNLTFGKAHSILDLAEIVRSRFPGIVVQHQPRDNLMPERGTLSVTKARELLGYRPRFSLETGISAYADWYRDFAERNPDQFNS